jgi:hypothetical protein
VSENKIIAAVGMRGLLNIEKELSNQDTYFLDLDPGDGD